MQGGGSKPKLPLIYVFVFAGPKVYGAPVTPLVNAQALEGLDLLGTTASDVVFHQQLEITGRRYGLAARRAPKIGPDGRGPGLHSELCAGHAHSVWSPP